MRVLIRSWAIGGVLLLLARAVWRLAPIAVEMLRGPLGAGAIGACVLWVGFMAYAEGYRGFHQRFNPCVVARAHWLADHPRPLRVLLAPAFAMGLFHASRRRLITSWSITLGVIVLIVLVGWLDQPWRGVVDLGVVVGLAIGGSSLAAQALLAGERLADPQLPERVADAA